MAGDLIGASAGAVAALLDPPARKACTWLRIAYVVLDVFTRVLMLLDAASSLPDLDATIVDAGWKRCREVALPQSITKVRPLPSLAASHHVHSSDDQLLQRYLVSGHWALRGSHALALDSHFG